MKISTVSVTTLTFAALSLLAACGGGGGGGGSITPPGGGGGGGGGPTPPPPTPTPITVSSTVYSAYDGAGHTYGTDNWQTNGTSDPNDNHDGDTASGGQGPLGGGQIDGQYSCVVGQEPAVAPVTYHVHAFLGIYVNGNAMAMPDAVGMLDPDTRDPILTFRCAYNMHTHSASGIVHIEDPGIAGNYDTGVAPPAKYNLQAVMDIWGQSLSGLDGASGPPAIYYGDFIAGGYTAPGGGKQDLVNSYTLWTGAASSLLVQHHRAIWLVYGTPPAAGLPQVAFGVSN